MKITLLVVISVISISGSIVKKECGDILGELNFEKTLMKEDRTVSALGFEDK